MSDAIVWPTVWLQQHANWLWVHDFFSDIGGPLGWWVLLQLVILLAGTRRGLRLAWFLGLAALTNTWLKWLWAEPRPYWVRDSISAVRATPGFGMPSGHAQGAMALWLGLWLALGKQGRSFGLALIVIVFVLFTGVSRVYYGVHSVAQVLAGFGFGLAGTLLLAFCLPKLEARLAVLGLAARAGFAALVLGVATAVSFAVYFMRADFVAPQSWQARFEATQIRIGHTGPLGDMSLVEGGSLVLLALLAGYALLALLASERGHRVAKSGVATLQCVLAATCINMLVLYVLRVADAGVAVSVVWLLIQPLVALWVPLHFFGEPEND